MPAYSWVTLIYVHPPFTSCMEMTLGPTSATQFSYISNHAANIGSSACSATRTRHKPKSPKICRFCLGPVERAAGPSVKSEAKLEFPESRFVNLPNFLQLDSISSPPSPARTFDRLLLFWESIHRRIQALSRPSSCWQILPTPFC